MTGVTRKLHEAAAVLGGGVFGALVAVVFGCGALLVAAFVYGGSDHLHENEGLLATAQVLGILGFFIAAVLAAIRGAGLGHAFAVVMLALCVVGFLCAGVGLDAGESLPLLAIGSCGLVPAAAIGLLARKIVDRSVARAEPSPGTAASSRGS